jgi:hypothetical protein
MIDTVSRGLTGRKPPKTDTETRRRLALFNLFFGFHVVDNRRAQSTWTLSRRTTRKRGLFLLA